MKKTLLAFTCLLAIASSAGAQQKLPADIELGVKNAPILVDATYEALAPDHGHRFRDAHSLELSYALQHPVVDTAAWGRLAQPAECHTFWQKARESHARVVAHFTLQDFHTNLDIDHAVIAGGVGLGVVATTLQTLARHLDEPDSSLATLCQAMELALPRATAVALSYPVKSNEYTDLAKLSITALASAIPTLVTAQQEARHYLTHK